MNVRTRMTWDHLFTGLCAASVVGLALVLLVFLIPMLGKGWPAVFFKGTVEFRKMQKALPELSQRGNEEKIRQETEETRQARQPVYELLERFSRGIDIEGLANEAKNAYRDYRQELRYREVPRDQYTQLSRSARGLRDLLLGAFESTDKAFVLENLSTVLSQQKDPKYQDNSMSRMFVLADEYQQIVKEIDLLRRDEYLSELMIVKEELHKLFGPFPNQPIPPLAQDKFGATRWDVAQRHLRFFLYQTIWIPSEDGQQMIQKDIRRDDPAEGFFTGTELEPVFAMVESNLEQMLNPRFTVYWQYFIDDSTPGHFFGGVGPEVIGTLTLTLLSMMFAVPLGVISAAYLVEYAGDNVVIKMIRTCINTLAGVPSIVYGLFGLAFFVLLVGEPNILTASLTLALLVLPVIIRASEEAIRAVPQTYREASLALGAGKFRTFITVTLPAAGPGILTGIILSLSRAAGETAPILFAGAVALGPIPDYVSGFKWLFQPTRALSYGCYDITVGDRLAMRVPHNQYGMVMTLILLVLVLNITAILIRSRMSKKLKGY